MKVASLLLLCAALEAHAFSPRVAQPLSRARLPRHGGGLRQGLDDFDDLETPFDFDEVKDFSPPSAWVPVRFVGLFETPLKVDPKLVSPTLLGAVLSTAAITGLLLVGSVTYGVLTSGGGEAREAAAPMLKGGANLELEMPGF